MILLRRALQPPLLLGLRQPHRRHNPPQLQDLIREFRPTPSRQFSGLEFRVAQTLQVVGAELAGGFARADDGQVADGGGGACFVDPHPWRGGGQEVSAEFVGFDAGDDVGDVVGVDGD